MKSALQTKLYNYIYTHFEEPVMKHKKIAIFLIICLIYNIFICGKGVMSIPDENIYYESVLAVDALFQKDVHGFSAHLNSSRGRPGEALFRVPAVVLQGLLYHFKGISPANQDSLKIPVFFNILVNLALLFVLYLLAVLLFQNSNYALLTVILYKLLVNSNIYLRHILPYEKSLLCLLFILYVYFSKKEKRILIYFGLGLLCGISFAIYPGYYFIPAFIGLIVFTNDLLHQKNIRHFFINGTSILSGFISMIAAFELFSNMGGESYLLVSSTLSDTISQGSFDESLLFPVKYLLEVENIPGIFILTTVIVMCLLLLKEIIKQKSMAVFVNNPIYWLFIFSLIGMILHGISGTFFHKMVFYGRLMHLYMPFLVIALVYVISQMKSKKLQTILFTVIGTVFLIHFILFTIHYQQLGYPKNMLYSMKIDNRKFSNQQFYYESSDTLFTVMSPNPLNKNTNSPYLPDSNYLLVNCCYYYPQESASHYKPFTAAGNLLCVADKQHYQTFPAYTFEGYNRMERDNIKKRKYRIQFYKTR
ncbi:MAG: hypothetical protein U0T77_11075 [Chitinophagales bacterium]